MIGWLRTDRRETPAWFDARTLKVDSVLAVTTALATVLAVLNSTGYAEQPASPLVIPHQPWQWAVLVAPSLCVIARRMTPTLAVALGAVGQTVVWLAALPDPYVCMAVLLYSAAAYGGRRGRRWAIGLSTALTTLTLIGTLSAEVPMYAVTIVALFSAASVAMGAGAAARQAYLNATEERATDAEVAAELARTTAISEERNRIARELHDVVAHGLSVIVVQAAAAQRVLDRNPEGARNALNQIEETGRTALREMRQVVNALRTARDESWRPVPGLAALDELVADLASVGLDVTLERRQLSSLPIPATMDLTAYRIVQESLTNVLKHGGPAVRARVVVTQQPGSLLVTVSDNGRGASAEEGGGHGLRGMRERVEVFGGRLRAGPRPGGGYEVSVVLPMTDRSGDRSEAVPG